MYEKELYPLVEKFLKRQKKCLSEYVGTELSLKRGRASLRADLFGVSNQIKEKRASSYVEPLSFLKA